MISVIVGGVRTIIKLLCDLATFIWLMLRPHGALVAENLFLRKQLAMYQERKLMPRRPDTPFRVALVLLSRLFDWKVALVVVQPQTLIRWHRLRKYMPRRPPGQPRGDQRWSTFVRNHAAAIVACDFCVVVTATFRLLYGLIVIEHQTRRLVHCNVTAHPTAAWTLQQLREAIPSDHGYQVLIHDRDSIFSPQFDGSITRTGLRVLGTPYQSPQGNSICERVIGTLRRECLDFVIPLTENHLRLVTKY